MGNLLWCGKSFLKTDEQIFKFGHGCLKKVGKEATNECLSDQLFGK